MRQLTIVCSRDLTESIVSVLVNHEIEGFVEIREVTGNRFEARDPLSRILTWDAVMLQVYLEEDSAAEEVVRDLRLLRKDCAEQPCLRLFLSPVEEVL